ncbi:tetratricopeptide repeat protein [Elizabethkingia occulta]|uniref:tetratricopeptide repeat protein n=1 Tax=Elizabethkingia occulta TaxID=1867263 RepID=UPI00398C2E0E
MIFQDLVKNVYFYLNLSNKIMNRTYVIFSLLFTILFVSHIDAQDNTELQKMADADQKSRMSGEINWKILNKEDSMRRERIFQLIKENKVQTAKDYLNVGIVFQHGNDTIASRMAVQSFDKTIKLDPSLNKWWYAAAVDRDLMRRGKPQIYGTQFIRNNTTNGKWKRYNLDPSKVTDEQRKYYKVETIKEQEEKERLMNLKSVDQYYTKENPSVDKLILLIKEEFKKGKNTEYNVNEDEINSFGYKLLKENKENEALEIFKLNTQLYPKGWNTYDSYGELLLKMGKKEEAKKSYQKSLKLNPKNENAIKVLKELS